MVLTKKDENRITESGSEAEFKTLLHLLVHSDDPNISALRDELFAVVKTIHIEDLMQARLDGEEQERIRIEEELERERKLRIEEDFLKHVQAVKEKSRQRNKYWEDRIDWLKKYSGDKTLTINKKFNDPDAWDDFNVDTKWGSDSTWTVIKKFIGDGKKS